MREFKSIQPILSHVRRAVDDFNMIEAWDRIAVGVSGGKDSLTMLCALKSLQRFYPKPFELKAICLDMGFENADFSSIVTLCDEIEVELEIVPTQIKQIVFDIRKEKCPCSLCARMRRGALHDAANAIGYKKIALGHHFDDAVETFFLNLFNEGRIGCFAANTYLDRKDVTVIRPLIYLPEKMVTGFVRKEGIEVLPKYCTEDGNTERERIKNLIFDLSKNDRGLSERIFGAMKRAELLGAVNKKEASSCNDCKTKTSATQSEEQQNT